MEWNWNYINCKYAEGNRCFLVKESNEENCKGCNWYKYSKGEDVKWPDYSDEELDQGDREYHLMRD